MKILAGGDTLDPYSFPGFNIHDELEELVAAGLSPAEALATATINPAEYFSVQDKYGSIEKGKVADLIFLKENPLNDIQHVRGIDFLIYNGQLYTRSELDQFLSYVESNNSGISGLVISLKMFWRMMKDNRH